MRLVTKLFFIFGWICIMTGPTQAASLSVACAANFTTPMKELVGLYEAKSGVEITCAFGSTGMLYGQILHGAPYDLFFAADIARPQRLHMEDRALTPTLYAKGRVVAWSTSEALSSMSDWKEAVSAEVAHRVAIPNPRTAPYGTRAEEALISAQLYDTIKPKLAYGKNVGASFQFAYSGAADIAFVAISQAISPKGTGGTYWAMPEAAPIEQAVCILKNGNIETASAFLHWLNSAPARAIIERYGYE